MVNVPLRHQKTSSNDAQMVWTAGGPFAQRWRPLNPAAWIAASSALPPNPDTATFFYFYRAVGPLPCNTTHYSSPNTPVAPHSHKTGERSGAELGEHLDAAPFGLVRATVPVGWTASGENKLRLVAG